MKYLLLVVVVYLIWRVWKKRLLGPVTPPAAASRPAERMLTCAHCAVHFPESDALENNGRFYCCEAHRQAAASAGQ